VQIARIFSSIFASGEAPHVPADAHKVHSDALDDLQETSDDSQENADDPQDTFKVRQVNKMTEYSWRNLSFDEEANTQLLEHFCKRGTSEKDPTKPGKPALLCLLLTYMVASGELVIERMEDGVPILSRGHVTATSPRHVTAATGALQETDLRVESSQTQSQSQAHAQQTPSQLAHANVRLAKMAYEKATRIAQERTQEAAQVVERIKQEATADSRKAKKAER
jgi:hypothetical protein